MSDALGVKAQALASALMDLQKALIHAEAGSDPAYANPYTLLFDVIGNPRFAWLDSLSQLIVELDEARADEDTFTPHILGDAMKRVARLIGDSEGHDPKFRIRHLMAVQSSAEVGLATGRLRAVLARLA